MPTPILATKLYIPPPRPNLVLRSPLIERMNEGLSSGCKLILISAPAGFGKTTLVSEWVATLTSNPARSGIAKHPEATGPGRLFTGRRGGGEGVKAAWLSLDEGDNDPARFLTYIVAALQALVPKIGEEVLAALQTPQPPSIALLLTTLLNEISAISGDFVLVFDDYHTIESKPVDEALTFFLENLPPQLHIVITTREDPHLPLARLRVRGQLAELRAADLRFTPAEAAEFLNRVMGLNLTEGDIAALEARTEGWIAGLQLAAVSMQGNPDASSFIKSFTGSHRFVLDYLLEEVLHRQPAEIQSFLLRTSILDRLCGPLCDAVLFDPSASGQETLEYLEHANLFIVSLDNERRWYRYHHLFADLLRQRLLQQPRILRSSTLSIGDEKYTVDERMDAHMLHRRASEWYERNGLAADAIHHVLAARDFERAATLIEKTVPEIRKNRQEATVRELGWLKALPDELIHGRPVLSVAYAYALFSGGELESVEDWLRDAERWLDTTEEPHGRSNSPQTGMVVVDQKEFRRLPGMIALLRTAQALTRGNMPETVKNARRVLDLAPEDDYLMLGGAASTLGLAAWTSGDLETASRMTAVGMANVRRAGYISPAIGGAIVQADIQIVQGRLREAMITYEHALQWATEPGTPILRGAADMHVGMSSLYYEHNDLNTATQHLLTSHALGELAGMPQNPYRWCAAMARIQEAQGDLDGALDLLDQAERLYNANFSPNVRPIAARKTRLWVAQGRLDESLDWVREQGLSVENELSYLHEFDHITLARVLIARYKTDRVEGDLHSALALLVRLLKAAEEGRRTGSVIEILVLQTLAYHAQDNLPAALMPLQRALALAEPEGYVRMFLDEGEPMRLMIADCRLQIEKQKPDPDHKLVIYTDKLLAAFSQQIIGQWSSTEGQNSKIRNLQSTMVEPLSQREVEVLRLIAQGLSNRAIGVRLFLALDTIKGYNRRIFDKLQVQSRTEAIARARELGLL